MMKRGLFILFVMAAVPIFAAAKMGFGIDAFNRAIDASKQDTSAFSPISYEFDSVIFCEANGALVRAKYAETMGVLTGLDAYYKPIYDTFTQMTGVVSFVSARAFCLPDERKAHTPYRQWMQETFSAESFSFAFLQGAECWFRARMDGDMEDFSIPTSLATTGYYCYYDLVSIKGLWKSPTTVDAWERKRHTRYRLALSNDCYLVIFAPNEGYTVRDIRDEFSSKTILDVLTGFKSVTELGLEHYSSAEVALPNIDVLTDCDLKPCFGYFQLPITEMDHLEKNVQPRVIRQRTMFKLMHDSVSASTDDLPPVKKFDFNRSFIYFIYHEPTSCIVVSGVYSAN